MHRFRNQKPPSLHQSVHLICGPGIKALQKTGLIGLLLLLTSCTPSPWDAALDRYIDGIARLLEQSPLHPQGQKWIKLDQFAPNNLLGAQSEHTLDLIDYLRTTPCSLHQLISERNSSLGQFSAAFTRLVYTVRFLHLVGPCITTLEQQNPELTHRLKSAAATKQKQLPIMLRSTILSGGEYQAFWKQPESMADYPQTIQSDLEVHLKALIQQSIAIKTGDFRGTVSDLDTALDAFNNGEGGLILKGWEDVHLTLTQANRMILGFKEKRPLCYQNRSNPRAENLRALIETIFIGRVQPQVSALNRRTYALMPLLTALEVSVGANRSPELKSFFESRAQRLEMGRQALRDHVALVGDLFEDCGSAIGSPNQ